MQLSVAVMIVIMVASVGMSGSGFWLGGRFMPGMIMVVIVVMVSIPDDHFGSSHANSGSNLTGTNNRAGEQADQKNGCFFMHDFVLDFARYEDNGRKVIVPAGILPIITDVRFASKFYFFVDCCVV